MPEAGIGVYSQPTVQPQGTPTPGYAEIQAPNPLGTLGSAIAQTGHDWSLAQYLNDRANSNNLLAQAKNVVNDQMTRVTNMVGHQASDPVVDENGQPQTHPDGTPVTQQDVAKYHIQNQVTNILQNASPGAVAMFNHRFDGVMVDFNRVAEAHLLQQGKVAASQDAGGQINAAATAANLDPAGEAAKVLGDSGAPPNPDGTPASAHSNLMDAYAAGRDVCVAQGIDPGSPAGQEILQKAATPVIKSTLLGLMQTDPVRAQQYWAATKAEVTPSEFETLDKTVNGGVAAKTGVTAAEALINDDTKLPKNQFSGLWDPNAFDKQASAMLTAGTITEQQFQHMVEWGHQRYQTAAVAHTQDTQTAVQGVYALFDKTKSVLAATTRPGLDANGQPTLPSPFAHLEATNPEEAVKLKKSLEVMAKPEPLTPEQSMQRFAGYWAYASNPQALTQMPDAAIFALAGKVGPDGVKDLLDQKQRLNAPGKVLASNVDTDQLKVFAAQAGIPVYDKTQDTKTGPQMGLLKYQVDAQIEAEQQAKGRELLRAEKDDIIKRNLVTYQTQGVGRSWANPARWFGSAVDTSESSPKFGFQLQPGDTLAIPDADAKALTSQFQAAGIQNPTQKQIQNAYVLKQQPTPSAAPALVSKPVLPKKPK